MTPLSFLLALGVLITVHEWGHYRVAVACGVKVLKFSVGFGRPLWRWKSRKPYPNQDTEFSIGLIPLGGYVKMLDEREAGVPLSDLPMAFNRRPLWARAAIVSAGPLMNVLFAICLYAATFWLGQYETRAILAAPAAGSVAERGGLKSGDTVLRVGTLEGALQDIVSLEALRWWMLQQDHSAVYLEVQAQDKQSTHILRLAALQEETLANDMTAWHSRGFMGAWTRPVLGEIQTGSPAETVGLKRSDEVLSVNGQIVTDGAALRRLVRLSGDVQTPEVQHWEVLRAGQRFEFDVTPERLAEGSGYIGRVGAQVGTLPDKVWVQYGLFEGLRQAFIQTGDVAVMTLKMLGRLLTGRASLDNLSGPISMADYAGRSASLGWVAYLSYLALLSISLGVFNLLPLPVLDGGHLLYYLYEACTGRPPSPQWLDIMQRFGVIVLAALMAFSLYNDVVRLGWLP